MVPMVRSEGVSFRYPQHDSGLSPTSLHVEAGDVVFVSGPSGSGKSTLTRCLVGLIPHLYRGRLSGRVWLDGLNTAETPMWRLAERAGLVFQNPAMQMLAVSVEEELIFGLENLGLSRAVIRDRLDATLNAFGLDHLRGRSPYTLSGGEQQKLALAAIMARQPAVLVLDEPLSMLDCTSAAELVTHFADLAHVGTTVVACEHRAEYLEAIPNLSTVYLDGHATDHPQVTFGPGPLGSTPSTTPFTLHVSNLRVELGGRPILQDVSFEADSGQVIAIVGRNGVGKTTLMRSLAGLQSHGGTISVDGQPPDLGIVFQNADLQLFNATVRDEILYRLPDPDMARYTWLLEVLGLTAYENTPPLLLSEGEKKRVVLATILMQNPRHGLLLDEPALGQDGAHKDRLVHLARTLAEAGHLVIMTTHDLGLAAQADRLLLLGTDGFVADGQPHCVLAQEAPWARLGLQVPDWARPEGADWPDHRPSMQVVGEAARR